MSSARRFARITPALLSVRIPSCLAGAAVANILPGQVGKMLGEKWKNLSDTERRPYEEKAAADKKRYEQEKEAYNVSSQCLDLSTTRTNCKTAATTECRGRRGILLNVSLQV